MVAASGTSGAGKAAKPHLLGSEVMGNASAYGVGGVHRHTPEIIQNLARVAGTPVSRSASPRSWSRCRAASSRPVRARLADGVTADDARGGLRQGVRRRAVRAPAPRGPVAADPVGARLQRRARAGHRRRARGRLVAVGAVDNLAKGTAGAAVQCMNLALGLDETTGLTTVGLAP